MNLRLKDGLKDLRGKKMSELKRKGIIFWAGEHVGSILKFRSHQVEG